MKTEYTQKSIHNNNTTEHTAFTSAHHLSLSWARSVQSISPHTTSWRSIL